tara:strand:- start:253 stop:417 length:165 start_codon:yes stop_codon:yes gene_type:complete
MSVAKEDFLRQGALAAVTVQLVQQKWVISTKQGVKMWITLFASIALLVSGQLQV